MNLCFQYHFHPVGQGLFASGCLYKSNRWEPRFLWVYDCGSVTRQNAPYWNARARDLKDFSHRKQRIDLLTISHFDKDHINGITALLGEFEVETLLVPYVPLWKRMVLAFTPDTPGANDDFMDFYVDPVSYLRNIQGAKINQIIIVGPSDGEGPELPGESGNHPDDSDGPWKLDVRSKRFDPDDFGETWFQFGTITDGLEFLPGGEALRVFDLWEFCPYNAPLPPQSSGFADLVTVLRENLLRGTADAKETALKDLKKAYDDEFGDKGEDRNKISLFLYAGPIYGPGTSCKLVDLYRYSHPGFPYRLPCYHRVHAYAPGETDKCSILYSGDGYLETPEKFEHLSNYFQPVRMQNLGVFQVNHHGSRHNWHDGLAGKINPFFSVFSSQPSRGGTKHPHAEVLRDYWPYSPIQVDTEGCSHCGWMLR